MRNGKTSGRVIKTALQAARSAIKKIGGNRKVSIPRVIPISTKVGGALPLIPIFAGLSALGAIAGGAAGITKAVNDASSARDQLEESKRHNRKMETISLEKGVALKPYKTGLGLYLKPFPKTGGGLRKKKKSSI